MFSYFDFNNVTMSYKPELFCGFWKKKKLFYDFILYVFRFTNTDFFYSSIFCFLGVLQTWIAYDARIYQRKVIKK